MSRALPRKIFPIVVLLLIFTSDIAADSAGIHSLPSQILLLDSLKSSLPLNAQWSFSAIDLETGKKLIDAGNAKDIPLVPASIIKLFVTAAILDMDAKEKIELDTIIAFDGSVSEGVLQGNLYLKGFGNAFLSGKDIKNAVEKIHLQGIRKIEGDIIVDDFFFDSKNWKVRYNGPAYSTPSALGIDMHTVSITVPGEIQDIEIQPPNESLKIIFNPEGKPNIRQIDDLAYEVSGVISDSAYLRKRFPLSDPSFYAGGTLKTLLKVNGIDVKGVVRKGEVPLYAKEIYRIESKDIAEIIKDTNINSLNLVADNLLFLLGAKRFGVPGTVEKGLKVVEVFLDELSIAPHRIKIADGSGLSTENRITSEQMTFFLKKASEKPWFRSFYKSFPRAGIDGTLKGINYKDRNIRAKTGQLDNVFSMVGYIERNNKSGIAFSYIVNVPGADLLSEKRDSVFALLRQIANE